MGVYVGTTKIHTESLEFLNLCSNDEFYPNDDEPNPVGCITLAQFIDGQVKYADFMAAIPFEEWVAICNYAVENREVVWA